MQYQMVDDLKLVVPSTQGFLSASHSHLMRSKIYNEGRCMRFWYSDYILVGYKTILSILTVCI